MKQWLNKVPEITIYFWIIKILSTTVGETGADFLADALGLGLAITSYVMSGVLLVALFIQFKLKRYVPASYWLVVILMSIVGTLITDVLVDDLDVSLVTITIVFTIMMIIGFAVWYINEKTLSIHSINTPKREVYYWIIILLAFALGTGVGDLLSEKLELGYSITLLIACTSMALITLGFYFLKMNATVTFWIAFILTRPLGASLGDLLIQPPRECGLGLNLMLINIVFLVIILGLITYLSINRKRDLAKEYIDI